MYIFLVTAAKAWCDFLWLHLGAHSLSTAQHDLSWKSGCLWRWAVYTLSIQAGAPWRTRGEEKKTLCTLVTLFCSHAEVPHSPAERISPQLRLNNTCLKNTNISICSKQRFLAQRSEGILAAVQTLDDASSIKYCVIILGSVFVVQECSISALVNHHLHHSFRMVGAYHASLWVIQVWAWILVRTPGEGHSSASAADAMYQQCPEHLRSHRVATLNVSYPWSHMSPADPGSVLRSSGWAFFWTASMKVLRCLREVQKLILTTSIWLN